MIFIIKKIINKWNKFGVWTFGRTKQSENEPFVRWEITFYTISWQTRQTVMSFQCEGTHLSVSPVCLSRKMNGTPCIVTKPCRDTMTRFGCPHYSLSHQLLYFMIGKMVTKTPKLFYYRKAGNRLLVKREVKYRLATLSYGSMFFLLMMQAKHVRNFSCSWLET